MTLRAESLTSSGAKIKTDREGGTPKVSDTSGPLTHVVCHFVLSPARKGSPLTSRGTVKCMCNVVWGAGALNVVTPPAETGVGCEVARPGQLVAWVLNRIVVSHVSLFVFITSPWKKLQGWPFSSFLQKSK